MAILRLLEPGHDQGSNDPASLTPTDSTIRGKVYYYLEESTRRVKLTASNRLKKMRHLSHANGNPDSSDTSPEALVALILVFPSSIDS